MMLVLDANEINIVSHWAEHGAGSPFPQEQNLLRRLKQGGTAGTLHLRRAEVEVIQFWAEKETAGKYGQSQYLLDMEYQLLDKINTYLEQFDR
jgi:hypothetical protein